MPRLNSFWLLTLQQPLARRSSMGDSTTTSWLPWRPTASRCCRPGVRVAPSPVSLLPNYSSDSAVVESNQFEVRGALRRGLAHPNFRPAAAKEQMIISGRS